MATFNHEPVVVPVTHVLVRPSNSHVSDGWPIVGDDGSALTLAGLQASCLRRWPGCVLPNADGVKNSKDVILRHHGGVYLTVFSVPQGGSDLILEMPLAATTEAGDGADGETRRQLQELQMRMDENNHKILLLSSRLEAQLMEAKERDSRRAMTKTAAEVAAEFPIHDAAAPAWLLRDVTPLAYAVPSAGSDEPAVQAALNIALNVSSSGTPWVDTHVNAYLVGHIEEKSERMPDFTRRDRNGCEVDAHDVVTILEVKRVGDITPENIGQVMSYSIQLLRQQPWRTEIYVGLTTLTRFWVLHTQRKQDMSVAFSCVLNVSGDEVVRERLSAFVAAAPADLGYFGVDWNDFTTQTGIIDLDNIKWRGHGAHMRVWTCDVAFGHARVATVIKTAWKVEGLPRLMNEADILEAIHNQPPVPTTTTTRRVLPLPRVLFRGYSFIVETPVGRNADARRPFSGAEVACLVEALHLLHSERVVHCDVRHANAYKCKPSATAPAAFLNDLSGIRPVGAEADVVVLSEASDFILTALAERRAPVARFQDDLHALVRVVWMNTFASHPPRYSSMVDAARALPGYWDACLLGPWRLAVEAAERLEYSTVATLLDQGIADANDSAQEAGKRRALL